MSARSLALAVLLLAALILAVATPSAQTASGRSWQVTPSRDLVPGTALRISGQGCLKPGTPTDELVVAVNSSRGLLGYVHVAADGSWSLQYSSLSPPPGKYAVQLNSVCLVNRGLSTVFNYSPVLTVTYQVPLNVTAFPVHTMSGRSFSSAVAFFAYPDGPSGPIPPSQFAASVSWGDGKVAGPAQVVSASKLVDKGLVDAEGYFVTASHTYLSAQVGGKLVVTVQPLGRKAARATATVDVWPSHPNAFFVANPAVAVQDAISLMMPAQTAPGQLPVVSRYWLFLDNGNPVQDDPTTRPLYNAAIANLLADPGSTPARLQAIALGILPRDANDLIGGLSDDNVRQVAQVWKAYWPYHIVPHLYDQYGVAGVGYETVDSSGRRDRFTRNVTIARDCLKWGGPLFGLFGGFTVCDTYNGIATQFGPHRKPDWVSIDVSKLFGNVGKAGFGGGVSLTVTHGVFQDPGQSIFLTVHLNAGLGISLGGTFAQGWVGPPDPGHATTDDVINSFTSGLTVNGGFSLGASLDGISIGQGFDAIYSPSTGTAGEQNVLNNTGFSATAGISCSWPLQTVPPNLASLLQGFMRKFSSSPPNAPTVDSAEASIAAALASSGFDLINSLPDALAQCG